MSIDGTRELEHKLKTMSDLNLKQAVSAGIQIVRLAAVESCHEDMGELRRSICAEVSEQDGKVIGTCWTDKKYAPYVEFGTGPKGQEKHEGISPEIAPAYTQAPWWIHESQVDKRVAEKYHWFHIDTPNGRFYQCTGQPAYPFMYPALKNNEDEILKEMKTILEGK